MPYYFGISDGHGEYTVTAGSSTTSKDLEVVINSTTNIASIQEVINSLVNIQNFMLRNGKSW